MSLRTRDPHLKPTPILTRSVLAWPAWLRVLAVLPVLALLWLGVDWALVNVVPL
jgi:hypothetical protein